MQESSAPRNKIDCSDIYAEEMEHSIKILKKMRERWIRSSSAWNSELFQYADNDFYLYRFIVDRLEKSTIPLLSNILIRAMERYGLSIKKLPDTRSAPFRFIIRNSEGRTGYRFEDFFCDENVNEIVKTYNVDTAVVIRTWKPGKADEWISRDNEQYQQDGLKKQEISLKTFFIKCFGQEEYDSFLSHLKGYLQEAREITGYQSIKFLSSMNLAFQKIVAENELSNWDYRNQTFQIIDKSNSQIQKYLYVASASFPADLMQAMESNYVSGQLFRTMTGGNEYADSFITSEWLYHSLKGRRNFDYTSVISGYLKSIEQLLYKIVMLNVDNGCKITMSTISDIVNEVNKKGIITYRFGRYTYIDLTSEQLQYIDSSIGSFEFFLRNNPSIFIEPTVSEHIADMVCCFRKECRNGYFHTHNLKNWEVVEKTRANAIYLYFVLLGACIIPKDKVKELGISTIDEFDELCKKIRAFIGYNTDFSFEYADGKTLNLVYARNNNTIEFTDDGIEHYESLLFYDIGEFSSDTYEKLDAGISEDQKVYLVRDNLPVRIFGIHRDGHIEEIEF